MDDRQFRFLTGILGPDGAQALRKAMDRDPRISTALVPRAILGWLSLVSRFDYEGALPGVQKSFLRVRKSEQGLGGSIRVGPQVFDFRSATVYHLAATMAVALGLESTRLDPALRDLNIQRLGKSIDTLIRARVAAEGLEERLLQKRILDPQAGYQFSHEHHDLGQGKMMTKVNVHSSAGDHVGAATFMHQGKNLVPGSVVVDDDHQRRGIGSAMYNHAQKLTGKSVIPSSNQTPEGAALWSGNMKTPQFGAAPVAKIELPGAANKPKAQLEPMAPAAPQPRGGQLKPPSNVAQPPMAGHLGPKLINDPPPVKPKNTMKVTKAQSERECGLCGRPQFRAGAFTGCLCFRDRAPTVRVRKSEQGYELTLTGEDWDMDTTRALMLALWGEN